VDRVALDCERTIQEGINAALSGQTVTIHRPQEPPFYWTEEVTIPLLKNITLQGADNGGPVVIDGADLENPGAPTTGIEVLANATVKNLTISNFGTAIDIGSATSGVIVEDVSIFAVGTAIDLNDSTSASILNSTLSNCETAIYGSGSQGVTVDNLNISQCEQGIKLLHGSNMATLTNITLSVIEDECIYVGGDMVKVQDSEARSCGGPAIRVKGTGPFVDNNNVLFTEGSAVVVIGESAIVSNNTVMGAGLDDDGSSGNCYRIRTSSSLVTSSITNNFAAECSGHGMKVIGSQFEMILNRAVAVGANGFEIECEGPCNKTKIAMNQASDTGDEGFEVDADGSNLVFEMNKADFAGDDAFYLDAPSMFATLNQASASGGSCFNILGSDGSFVFNTAFNCLFGFEIDGDGTMLSRNLAWHAGAEGPNTSDFNLEHGFVVEASNVTIDSSVAMESTKVGMYVDEEAVNTKLTRGLWLGNHTDFCNESDTTILGQKQTMDQNIYESSPEADDACLFDEDGDIVEEAEAECGDGVKSDYEVCDGTDAPNGCPGEETCNEFCTVCEAVCGDGVLTFGELCETDGNLGCAADLVCNNCTVCEVPAGV
jgi:hypothetical protein